jgi:hypothetical protein
MPFSLVDKTPLKHWYLSTGFHGVMTQKVAISLSVSFDKSQKSSKNMDTTLPPRHKDLRG